MAMALKSVVEVAKQHAYEHVRYCNMPGCLECRVCVQVIAVIEINNI